VPDSGNDRLIRFKQARATPRWPVSTAGCRTSAELKIHSASIVTTLSLRSNPAFTPLNQRVAISRLA
jgi:hypothetical protein